MLLLSWLLCIIHTSYAQNGNVSGTVTDIRDNSPVANATVRIKGGASTTTSPDGSFSLPSDKTEVTLEITSIGFAAKILKASAGQSVSVPLLTDVRTLNEVVVTGVGVATNKKKLGISVESITSDKLPPAPQAAMIRH